MLIERYATKIMRFLLVKTSFLLHFIKTRYWYGCSSQTLNRKSFILWQKYSPAVMDQALEFLLVAQEK